MFCLAEVTTRVQVLISVPSKAISAIIILLKPWSAIELLQPDILMLCSK